MHVDLGRHRDARHAGQARPPLRRGGPAHRHRPGRAALHGRLVRRPQGDRARRRAVTRRSAPSTPPASWRTRSRSSATSSAIRCTRSSSRSCAMLGEFYALNTVIDEDRDLVHVTFGEIIESHLAAVEFVAAMPRAIEVAARFKTVVTSSAGYPLDKTYYQTVKGMVTPLDILEPGGTLIIASACSEGLRLARVPRGAGAAGRARPRALPRHADGQVACRGRRVADRDAAEADAARPRRSSTPPASTRRSAASPASRSSPIVDAGVADSIARHDDPDVAVIPEGPYVVPVADGAAPMSRLVAIHLDAVGGIAGDMFVAALVDAVAGAAAPRAGGCSPPCCRAAAGDARVHAPATSAGLRALRFGAAAAASRASAHASPPITHARRTPAVLPRHGRRASAPRRSATARPSMRVAILRHPGGGRSRDPWRRRWTTCISTRSATGTR